MVLVRCFKITERRSCLFIEEAT